MLRATGPMAWYQSTGQMLGHSCPKTSGRLRRKGIQGGEMGGRGITSWARKRSFTRSFLASATFSCTLPCLRPRRSRSPCFANRFWKGRKRTWVEGPCWVPLIPLLQTVPGYTPAVSLGICIDPAHWAESLPCAQHRGKTVCKSRSGRGRWESKEGTLTLRGHLPQSRPPMPSLRHSSSQSCSQGGILPQPRMDSIFEPLPNSSRPASLWRPRMY